MNSNVRKMQYHVSLLVRDVWIPVMKSFSNGVL